VLYRLRIVEAKREMKKILLTASKQSMIHFSFSPTELAKLNWENSHEFFFRGEMYDVLEKKECGGRVVISCISDRKEKALVEAYLETGKESPHRSTTTILKLLTADYLPTCLPAIEKPVQQITVQCSFYQFFLFPWEELILTPPPEVC
jgi:hypothetical protein